MDKKEIQRKDVMGRTKEKFREVIERYNIDLGKLKKEQEKLAKSLRIEDSINFELAERIAGVDNIFFRNKTISVIVVLDSDFEVLEQEYFSDKVRFPYISGFRAYRELPSMVQAFNKLDEKPDVVFIRAHGILHPRGLGLASHFSLAVNVPVVGIADFLLVGKIKGEDVLLDGKVAGKVVKTKEGAKPLFVSPGNMISLESAAELVRKFTREPHKLPEPLRLTKRYAKEVRKEIFKG
jgi:deoxyribonuclease V